MVPTRAAMEQQPTAMPLMTVAKSSEETVYTTQKEAVMPNFPSISSKMATLGNPEQCIKKNKNNQ